MFKKKTKWAVVAVILLLSGGAILQAAQTSPAQQAQNIFDNWYIMTDSQTKEQTGVLHQQVRKTGQIITVVEELSVEDQDGTVGYKTEVRYDVSSGVKAQSADVMTYVDGVPYMTAGIKITADEVIMIGSETDKAGKAVGSVQTERLDLPKNSAIVFRQGLCTIAPMLLGGKSELTDVVFIYSPAELDAPAEIDTGYVLKKTDKGGSMVIELLRPEVQDVVCRLEVDSEGVREGSIFSTVLTRTTREIALSGLKPGSQLSGK